MKTCLLRSTFLNPIRPNYFRSRHTTATKHLALNPISCIHPHINSPSQSITNSTSQPPLLALVSKFRNLLAATNPVEPNRHPSSPSSSATAQKEHTNSVKRNSSLSYEEEEHCCYYHYHHGFGAPDTSPASSNEWVVIMGRLTGAISIGMVVLLVMGMVGDDDGQKALAIGGGGGPGGPMVEEFWENVRRYALYALTVSTGVVYTVFQPIVELLKNPVSAVLVLIIIGGTIFIVSQVLSAMVGVSEFNYEYGY